MLDTTKALEQRRSILKNLVQNKNFSLPGVCELFSVTSKRILNDLIAAGVLPEGSTIADILIIESPFTPSYEQYAEKYRDLQKKGLSRSKIAETTGMWCEPNFKTLNEKNATPAAYVTESTGMTIPDIIKYMPSIAALYGTSSTEQKENICDELKKLGKNIKVAGARNIFLQNLDILREYVKDYKNVDNLKNFLGIDGEMRDMLLLTDNNEIIKEVYTRPYSHIDLELAKQIYKDYTKLPGNLGPTNVELAIKYKISPQQVSAYKKMAMKSFPEEINRTQLINRQNKGASQSADEYYKVYLLQGNIVQMSDYGFSKDQIMKTLGVTEAQIYEALKNNDARMNEMTPSETEIEYAKIGYEHTDTGRGTVADILDKNNVTDKKSRSKEAAQIRKPLKNTMRILQNKPGAKEAFTESKGNLVTTAAKANKKHPTPVKPLGRPPKVSQQDIEAEVNEILGL